MNFREFRAQGTSPLVVGKWKQSDNYTRIVKPPQYSTSIPERRPAILPVNMEEENVGGKPTRRKRKRKSRRK